MNSVSINITNNPTMSFKEPTVPFCENVKTAANQVIKSIGQSRHWSLGVLKATIALPTAIILTAVTAVLVCLAVLLHVALFPVVMTYAGWNKENAKDYLFASANEIKSFALAVLTFPIDGTQFDPKPLPPGQRADKTPILCINGWLHSSSAWHFFRSKMEEAGSGPIYTIDVGGPFEPIEEKAKRIKAKVEQIAKDTGRDDIVLIGHSMGGLSSSYSAVFDIPKNNVKAVITLGSPLQGTKMAKNAIGIAAKQMHYKSPFIIKLDDGIEKASHIKFFDFGSKTDLIVSPTSAARLPNASHIKSHEYSRCGHLTYLYSPEVVEQTLSYLKDI